MRTAPLQPAGAGVACRTVRFASSCLRASEHVIGERRARRLVRGGPCAHLLLIVTMAVAGCADAPATDGATDEEGEAPAKGGPVVLVTELAAGMCSASTVVVPTGADQAAAQLPPGVTPIVDPLASFILRIQRCADTDRPPGAHGSFEVGVLIEEPPVPGLVRDHDAGNRTPHDGRDRRVDLYLVAGYADIPAWLGVFRQAGVPGAEARITVDAPQGSAGASLWTTEAIDDAGTVFASHVAAAASETASEHRRAWRESDHGLLLVESDLAPSTAGGPRRSPGFAECQLREGTPAADALGRDVCEGSLGENVEAEVRTRAYWFHETFFTP